MDVKTYRLMIKAFDLSSRTFGNNEKKGPIFNFEMAGHCEVVTMNFYKDGWKPDTNPTASIFYAIGWDEEGSRDKVVAFLDYCEGEIKAWEALNK